MDGCSNIHRRKIAIIPAVLLLLFILTITPRLAVASPYSSGYSHGCDDGRLGFHKYLNTPGYGIDYHTPEFMQGYDKGYKACFSPNGTSSGNKVNSNQIQEVHLYRVIDQNILMSIVMDIAQEL